MLRLHPLHALVRRSGCAIATALRSSHPQTPIAGWRLEYLSWRPERDQRVGQSIFCAETRQLFGGRSVYARGACQHHAPRRHSADEHLQQTLSGAPGPVPVEISADDSCGNGSPAKLGAISHLQNVVMEPRDAHAARHYQSFQAYSRPAWRKAITRTLSSRNRASRFAVAPQREVLDLAQ